MWVGILFVPLITQLAFTCSKLTIETLEQGVGVVLVSLLLTLNIFRTLCVSIVNFEHALAGLIIWRMN